jgi:hypothetical protein
MNSNKHPAATHAVVDMVAEGRSTRTDAGANAEFLVREEAGPFMVLVVLAESISEQKTANCFKKRR